METTKTSTRENSLIWFGAAASIAEIMTGSLIAPLGFTKGLTAILLGHLIGCVLLYLAGKIGGETGLSAMNTVKRSFGTRGSSLFAVLNVLQLVGWTSIMIWSGSEAAATVTGTTTFWSIAIGTLIVLWIVIGITNLGRLNTIIMALLFGLTAVLFVIILKNGTPRNVSGDMSFGIAVELSAAMPLSWLPLISDYTRYAAKPKLASLASSVTYFLTSCWMYVIGMTAALLTGEFAIGRIMMTAGLGLAGIFIIVSSTVTTTFMDAYSAGASAASIFTGWHEKAIAVGTTIIGVLLAILNRMNNLESFLYLIGSVFAPMIAIQITDYYLLRKQTESAFDFINLSIWLIGFIIYRIIMRLYTPVGVTLPAMFVTIAITLIVALIRKKLHYNNRLSESFEK